MRSRIVHTHKPGLKHKPAIAIKTTKEDKSGSSERQSLAKTLTLAVTSFVIKHLFDVEDNSQTKNLASA